MEAPAPRVAVVLAAALLGFLAVLGATQPPGAPRELRRFELADLVEAENAKVRSLRAELAGLRRDIESLELGGGDLRGLREEISGLAATGGWAAMHGPGLVVTLDDSSSPRSPSGDPNDLVVHEADIQTVVNALWGAGAEVVALNGERLTSASAVRCAGNTLLLHGTLHSPPYRIAAIGDPDELAFALARQPGMGRLAAESDAFGRGFDVETTTIELAGGPPARQRVVGEPVTS
ncbi:MAG: DUF881 domain-containing protein [Actinomycetota bacterium]